MMLPNKVHNRCTRPACDCSCVIYTHRTEVMRLHVDQPIIWDERETIENNINTSIVIDYTFGNKNNFKFLKNEQCAGKTFLLNTLRYKVNNPTNFKLTVDCLK